MILDRLPGIKENIDKRLKNIFNKKSSEGKPLFLHVSLQDKILFMNQMSLMIKSGTPIIDSLRIIFNQQKNPSFKYVLGKIVVGVENGNSLSSAMSEFENIFGAFVVNVIHIGDSTGALERSLSYLSDELKKRYNLRRKIKGALVYPAVIVVATIGITSLLVLYVFPKVLPIFSNLKFKLPLSTRILVYTSDVLGSYWWALIIILGVIVVVLSMLMRIVVIKRLFDRFVLKIPAIGGMLLSYQLANICRTLGLLLKSGVRIEESVSITSTTCTNLAYRTALERIKVQIISGERMSVLMQDDEKLFPILLTQMISVGEGTGNLSHSLAYLAEMYESDVDDRSQNLSTILEPVLMVVMGLVVGFIAVAIMTPIYEVTQNIR